MLQGAYVSADEVERAGALIRGYRQVCQHPGEVGVLERDEILVIDFDHVLFGDTDLAATTAVGAARRGVRVGVHTYHLENPRLTPLRSEPNLMVGKTHDRVYAALRRMGPPVVAVAAMSAA